MSDIIEFPEFGVAILRASEDEITGVVLDVSRQKKYFDSVVRSDGVLYDFFPNSINAWQAVEFRAMKTFAEVVFRRVEK